MPPVDEEAARMMDAAGVTPGDVGEQAEHGHLIAAAITVQCDGCLRRIEQQLPDASGQRIDPATGQPAEPTFLSVQVTNEMPLEELDLRIPCPKCSAVNRITTCIPIDFLVGAEVEEHDDGLTLLEQLHQMQEQPMDAAPPFAVDPSTLTEAPKPVKP